MENMNQKKTITLVCSLLTLLALTLVSCTAKYGYLKNNQFPADLSDTGSLLPDYDYYYAGRADLPYAVIGINRNYKFVDRGWFKIDNRADISNKIYRLDDRPGVGVSNHILFADIVSSSGTKVGVWFSYYTDTVIEVDLASKTIIVLNPYTPGEAKDS